MITLIVQSLVFYTFSWVTWKLLQRYVSKSDFHNLPGPTSNSFWKGHMLDVFDPDNGWEFSEKLAEKFGRVVRLSGLFGAKLLFVYDPKAMHHIIVKDQHIFEESVPFLETNRAIFGDGLLSSLGEIHRRQRKILNPVFSTSRVRQMIPIFYDVAHKLQAAITSRLTGVEAPQEVDIHKWMSRTALELIGQTGLGYSFDSLVEVQTVHPYSDSVKQLMPVMFAMSFSRIFLLPILIKIGSKKFQRFVVGLVPWKNLHRLRDIIDIMHTTTVEVFESKKRAIDEGGEAVLNQIGQGKDILSVLMKENTSATVEDRLSDEEVLAQMSTLVFAGTDTTSNALSRILYLLASRPEVQEKLRMEIEEARSRYGDIPYDELVSLPFLDAVCRETLRLHPPIPFVLRVAREDAILPFSTPIKGVDGEEITQVTVPKNTEVVVSIMSINRDPALWGADSCEWKPERWLSPLPDSLLSAHVPGVYSHTMTFLGGGRSCIGFKFSQLEMKVVLSLLLSKFRFMPSDKEIIWEMDAMITPTVKGTPRLPQLPVLIETIPPT